MEFQGRGVVENLYAQPKGGVQSNFIVQIGIKKFTRTMEMRKFKKQNSMTYSSFLI